MIRSAIALVGAIALVLGGVLGYERWQDHRRAQRTATEVRTAVHAAAAAVAQDGVTRAAPGVAAADTGLTRILSHPRALAPPVVYVHDTVPGSIDSAAYVPAAALWASQAAYDSLARAATAYRDSTRAQLLRYPRLVAEQDSVIRYQRRQIDMPAPRRNWGIGVSAGYGPACVAGTCGLGPSVHVGISYSF